jgi:hypothetical protein
MLRKNKTVSAKNPTFLFIMAMTVVGTVISSAVINIIQNGQIGFGIVDYFVAYWIPVLSPLLNFFGIITVERLWMWYVIGISWIATGAFWIMAFTAFGGNLTQENLDAMKKSSISGSISSVFTGIIVAVLYFAGFSNLGEIYFALSLNVMSLPIVLFTDLMDFEVEVWVVLVLYWIAYWKIAMWAQKN